VELMARASHQTDAFSFHPVITCQCFPNAEKTYQYYHHASGTKRVICKFLLYINRNLERISIPSPSLLDHILKPK